MKKLNLLAAFFLFLSLAGLFAFTQRSWQGKPLLEKILAKLTAFHQNYPQEKVYLHLDKPYYAAGEDIWFKAYLVDATNHTPSELSKVLYVELINPQDSVYSRIVLDVQDGVGHGDFALSDTISDGLYRIRAYTSWMQNFDEAYFFHQKVNILNPREDNLVPALNFDFKRQPKGDSVLVKLALKNVKEELVAKMPFSFNTVLNRRVSNRQKGQTGPAGEAQIRFFLPDGAARQNAQLALTFVEGKQQTVKRFRIPLATNSADVQFFPEGGHLVNGIWNTVGFKGINSNGLGIEVQGAVFDQTGQKVADLKSLALGMGRFGFTPEKGKSYEARIKGQNGAESRYPLTKALDQGVVLTVDNTRPDSIRIRAFLLGYEKAGTRPKSLSLIGQSRGQVFFSGGSSNVKDVLVVKVPKKNFPTGIAQFTLFSEAGEPLAERLVFIHPPADLQVSVTPDKPLYKPREKVNLQVEVKDAAGTPVQGNFSLAVTDAQTIEQNENNSSILSNLLLTSDLRGHIESPGYYFSSQKPEVALALDNLLLTQGWRRFVWKDVLAGKAPALTAPLEKGLAISGTVLKLNGKPAPNALLTLFGVGKQGFMLMDSANAQGKFVVGVSGMRDSTRLLIKARDLKGKDQLTVNLDKGLPVAIVTPKAPYFPLPESFSSTIWSYAQRNREQLRLDQLSGKSILLNAVQIRGNKLEEERARSGIHTYADRTLDLATLNKDLNLFSAISGRSGLRIKYDDWGQRTLILSLAGSEYTPTLLLDGMAVDGFVIETLRIEGVQKIEILHPGAAASVYGMKGTQGIVAVTMKPGGMDGALSSKYKGVAVYEGVGYYAAREFYMPRYDTPQEVDMPDLRSTIFWAPTIRTDATGKADVSFFAADARTTYNAILEGLAPTGQIGRHLSQIQVR